MRLRSAEQYGVSEGAEKRTKGVVERDEFLRSLWRMEICYIDPGRLVFVDDEVGTHTSLAPLYAYLPIGERALAVAGSVGFGVGLLAGSTLRASFPAIRGVGSFAVTGVIGGAYLGVALGCLKRRRLAEEQRSRVR